MNQSCQQIKYFYKFRGMFADFSSCSEMTEDKVCKGAFTSNRADFKHGPTGGGCLTFHFSLIKSV